MRQSLTKHSSSLGRDAVFEKAVSIARLPYCLPVQFVRFYYNAKKKLNAKIVRVRLPPPSPLPLRPLTCACSR